MGIQLPTPLKAEARPLPKAGAINICAGHFKDHDVKILILGPGDSGKSTILRQLRLVYCGGFDADDRASWKSVVKSNVLADAKSLIRSLERSGRSVAAELANSVELVRALPLSEDALLPEVAEQITAVWNDPIMKVIYQEESLISLSDNAAFFLDNVTRIAQEDYHPTNEDLFKSHVRTTGIGTFNFLIDSVKTQIVEVGGHRSERGRWGRCFQDVTFLMFVVSLSDFDQWLFEDEGTPRTQDSMGLFGSIANSGIFASKQIFLVLNKVDVFKKKLAASPDKFKTAYPGFTGNADNPDEAIDWVRQSFLSKLDSDRAATASVEAIPCCAIEPQSIRDLFQKIGQTVLEHCQ
jgi:GTPase SAR1 family protein